ncbi:MAG: NAD(P)-binding protein [Alphaproteobacteria bacterium]|nr:NAD(P)-binding protein [Alphaproteobacteria bacterium]
MPGSAAANDPLGSLNRVDDARRHFDVLIIGAGLSGIGAAYHLQKNCPGRTFAILEGRQELGGTWDLFRYPGIRSDSDMFTLGYRFYPWTEAKAIADGPSIKDYVIRTANEFGLIEKIRFNHWVTDFSWSSADARWTVTVGEGADAKRFTCDFVWNCSGYYRYSEGYMPAFPGVERFQGRLVHPQNWPADLDFADQNVVVIGSGATAVTLVPSMAANARHVAMLQRSPTYMFAMPATSGLAQFLAQFLPKSIVYRLMRSQRIVLQQVMFKLARATPNATRRKLMNQAREKLGPDYDVDTHFGPAYNPWDQRICLVPDDDLYAAINSGKASVVTDRIDAFEANGIRLASGQLLEADIVVSATGLILEAVGGASLYVDGERVNLGDKFIYKGLMYEDVPNFVSVFGYANASWTLRADLVSDFTTRLLNHMRDVGKGVAKPVNDDPTMPRDPFLDFSSGFVKRATPILPKQGRWPWRHPQDFFRDFWSLRHGKIEDGVLRLTPRLAQAGSAGFVTQKAAAE